MSVMNSYECDAPQSVKSLLVTSLRPSVPSTYTSADTSVLPTLRW